jgi:hypothetical protein
MPQNPPEPVPRIVAPTPQPLDGNEPLVGLDATVLDFWRFALPDLRMNNVRGWLAEFLVWRALGVERPRRIEWDAFDVEWEGIRIEVKSTALLQGWDQRALSNLTFTGLSARAWDDDAMTRGTERAHNADVYVFAAHLAQTHDDYDPLDMTQWHFAVLGRDVLERLGVRSLSWSRVLVEAGGQTPVGDLPRAVRRARGEGPGDQDPRET